MTTTQLIVALAELCNEITKDKQLHIQFLVDGEIVCRLQTIVYDEAKDSLVFQLSTTLLSEDEKI